MAKPAKKKNLKDAIAFLDNIISTESVAEAKDQNVSVTPADQPKIKEDTEEKVIPKEEVDASAEGAGTKTLTDTTQDGKAQTQDVKEVSSTLQPEKGNDEETNHVDGKTPEGVKAGQKDLTQGVISQEDNIETAEAESVITDADDAVMDVGEKVKELEAQGVTQATDAAVERAEEVGHEIETFNRVEAALEEYQELLADKRKKGEPVSRDLARVIQIGLKSHNRDFFAATVPSLESFDRPLSAGRATISLERSIADNLKDVGKAAGNAIKRLIEMIIDAWHMLTRDTSKLTAELDAVAQKLKTGSVKEGETQFVRGGERLFVGDEFVGTSLPHIKAVETVSRELFVEWPAALGRLVDVIEGQAKQVSIPGQEESPAESSRRMGGEAGEVFKTAEEAVSATFHSFKEARSDRPSEFGRDQIVTRSPILPGNKAMFIGVNEAGETSPFTFVFESVAEAGSGKGEFTVPSAADISSAIQAVKGMINNVIAKDASMANLKALKGKMASDKNSTFGKVARNVVTVSLQQHRKFMGYLISLIKAYISVFNHLVEGQAAIGQDK